MTTQLIQALSGLGMFLFGMLYMELALKEAAGVRFKTWIKNSTSTTMKSLMSGAVATALLQSSSVVTLMTLSFVSASLISMHSGIAVIFGSNVGTTITSWVVATLGFKVKIEAFALPLIGAGGLMLILGDSHKRIRTIAKVFVGFGLLFLGLDIMKTAIESLAGAIDLAKFTNFPLITFVGIGFLLTALIQSSSAATAIVLSALYVHILNFEQSAAMVIGTNIGTTVTAILGAIGGIPDKKRVAMAHFIFNFITATAAFLLLPFLTHFVMDVVGLHNDPVTALAMFHTLFNLLGVVLLLPFISLMAEYLNRLFIHKEPVSTKYIHLVDPELSETALVALKDEVNNLFVKTMKYALLIANIKPNDVLLKKLGVKEAVELNQEQIEFDHKIAYNSIKDIEIRIMEFVSILNHQDMLPGDRESLKTLLASVRENVYAAKILKDIKNDMNEFSESSSEIIHDIYDSIRKNLVYAILIYVNYMEEEWSMDKCIEKFSKAEEENELIMKEATLSISKKGINEKKVVSLLNTNRSVSIASQALFEASKSVSLHFPLED
ncbi:MAG: Na/Pi symporter [Sulfurovum sp.]|uniref:Na/Pi cotransporter family protein n=1 Tax=Sulfurovum sp. TaxID=1969726 RepID=UPI003C78BCD2